MTNCLNCGTVLQDHYCPHCGQKAEVKRLTWAGLIEEGLHFFTHIEKGFFSTVQQLIFRPGILLKNYLDGKRKRYHKPISFLLIWVAVFLLVFHEASVLRHFENQNTATLLTQDSKTFAVINKYRSLIEILMIPVISLLGWLFVARPKLNFVEIVTINFYITSFLFILISVQLLIAIVFNINFKTNAFDLTTVAVYLIWVLYAGYDFYKQYHIRLLFPRLVLVLVVGAVVYFSLTRMIAQALIALNLA